MLGLSLDMRFDSYSDWEVSRVDLIMKAGAEVGIGDGGIIQYLINLAVPSGPILTQSTHSKTSVLFPQCLWGEKQTLKQLKVHY
jgi:hypothetical protein